MWPESTGPQGRTNLRQLLHHLKRALPASKNLLRVDHFNVHWDRGGSCSIDVVDFLAALAHAAEAVEEQEPPSELKWLTRAAQIYVDDLLPAVYDQWLVPIRQDLRAHLSTALHRLASLLERFGDVKTAIACAERLVAHDATAEAGYQLLMQLHIANRDRASAVRTYHQCKAVLRRELGVAPGRHTVLLFESILQVAPSQLAQPAAMPSEQEKIHSLIGRVPEMKRLELAWESAKSGRALAFIISGEPGIGKTRVAEEFLHDAERSKYAVARSRCHSGHGQVAYAPVAQWLRSGALRTVWPALSVAQRAELARLVPEMHEPAVGTSDPSAPSESWQKHNLYAALDAAFGKIASPLVLFIDDLQWCDADSLDWLQLVLSSGAVKRVLVIGTVRGEEIGRDHPFSKFLISLRQVDVVVELPLRPLDVAGTASLARQESAEFLTAENLAQIYEFTKGHPLFVVESVRAGLQSKRIHAVISARLAGLSAASYELAGLASVVGRTFSFELLEKASDWDEHSLLQALDELWQRQIIEGRGGAEYDFTHDRIREVASIELSPVRLRYLHRRVARALTEVYTGNIREWDGHIALHYEQAGMVEQAIDHLCAAADLARHRFAYAESAQLLRRALTLLRPLPESAKSLQQELDILVLLGTALVTTEGYSAAGVGNTYGRALSLSRRLGEYKLFTILSGSWVFHVVGGQVETSRQEALEFLTAAGRSSSSELELAGNFLLGSSLSHLGQLEGAFQHLTSAFEIHKGSSASVLEVFGGPDVRVFCRAYLSHVAWHLAPDADDTSADRFIAEAVHAAEDMNHPFIQAIAFNYSAMLHALRGDGASALEVGRQAVELCSRHGYAYYLAMAKILTAWAMCETGESSAGLEQFSHGLERLRTLGAELRLPFFYALLAQSFARAGMSREASTSLATGFAFTAKNGEEWTLPELHRVQGDLLRAEGEPEQAAASYRRGLGSAQRCGSLAFQRRLTKLLVQIVR